MTTTAKAQLKVADEVWIAAALLHREHPEAADFSIEEIVERVRKEGLHETMRPGIYVHVVQHCVANRPPNPGRYRMLFETAAGRRRLFRKGDPSHPDREGAKVTPRAEELPRKHAELLGWYEKWCDEANRSRVEDDPLLKLKGLGAHLWVDETPDEYVERLREGWE